MSLSKEIDKLKYDKRLMNWYLSHGLISQAEVNAYIASLPDLASNVEKLNLGGAAELDEDIDDSDDYVDESDSDGSTF